MSTDFARGPIAGASPQARARAAGACWLLVIVTGALAMVGGGKVAVAATSPRPRSMWRRRCSSISC